MLTIVKLLKGKTPVSAEIMSSRAKYHSTLGLTTWDEMELTISRSQT